MVTRFSVPATEKEINNQKIGGAAAQVTPNASRMGKTTNNTLRAGFFQNARILNGNTTVETNEIEFTITKSVAVELLLGPRWRIYPLRKFK